MKIKSPNRAGLPLESQATDEEQHSPAEHSLEISSVTEQVKQKPLVYRGYINHAPVNILIDSGAMGDFISEQTVRRISLPCRTVSNVPIRFANGTIGTCNKEISTAYLQFDKHDERINLR